MKIKENKLRIFIDIIVAMILAGVLSVYSAMDYIFLTKEVNSMIYRLVESVITGWQTYVLFVVILAVMFLVRKYPVILQQIYRFRFGIAGIIFVLCVALGISGSSIGAWCDFTLTEDTGLLLGVSRAIRSDEWAVSMPMNIAQYFHANGFEYFSDSINGTVMDFFMGYRQPVMSIYMIFKPFLLGYLFLPAANAMAFFWVGKLLLISLVTFEFGMIITKGSKKMSLITTLLIAFSPTVQWWFSTAIADLIIYTLLSVILFKKYLETQSGVRRIPYVAGIMLCAGCFIMTLYPAWMIPFFYVIIALVVWLIWEQHKSTRMKLIDWGVIAVFGAGLAVMIFSVMSKSAQSIEITANTTYPGQRISTGGGGFALMFGYITNIWGAFAENMGGTNICEASAFLTFFPMSYILAGFVLFRDKIKDKFLICMLVVATFFGLFCVFTIPEWLAKITFLSNCPTVRIITVFGFCNVLILIRSIVLIKKSTKKITALVIAVAAGVLTAYVGTVFVIGGFLAQIDKWIAVVLVGGCAAILIIVFYVLMRIKEPVVKSIFYRGIVIIAVVSGVIVNPVRMGIDSIYNISWIEEVQKVSENDKDALWAVADSMFPYNNISLFAGAKTINSTNVYPDLELWKAMDTTGGNEDIYNRYAHVIITLKAEGESEFELLYPDVYCITTTPQILKENGVKYILSDVSLCDEIIASGEVTLINGGEDCCIYEIK